MDYDQNIKNFDDNNNPILQPCLGGTPGMMGYGMAKAAVHQLVKRFATLFKWFYKCIDQPCLSWFWSTIRCLCSWPSPSHPQHSNEPQVYARCRPVSRAFMLFNTGVSKWLHSYVDGTLSNEPQNRCHMQAWRAASWWCLATTNRLKNDAFLAFMINAQEHLDSIGRSGSDHCGLVEGEREDGQWITGDPDLPQHYIWCWPKFLTGDT